MTVAQGSVLLAVRTASTLIALDVRRATDMTRTVFDVLKESMLSSKQVPTYPRLVWWVGSEDPRI